MSKIVLRDFLEIFLYPGASPNQLGVYSSIVEDESGLTDQISSVWIEHVGGNEGRYPGDER